MISSLPHTSELPKDKQSPTDSQSFMDSALLGILAGFIENMPFFASIQNPYVIIINTEKSSKNLIVLKRDGCLASVITPDTSWDNTKTRLNPKAILTRQILKKRLMLSF